MVNGIPDAAKFSLPHSGVLLHSAGMGMRREARECAVQFLYQHEMNPPKQLEESLSAFWENRERTLRDAELITKADREAKEAEPQAPTARQASLRLFAESLIRGVIDHLSEVDEWIQKMARNWSLNRMASIDRNVLRLAIYEMLYREDIPPVVSINEAVEIAKRFSTYDSGKFVNGILDRARKEILRPARSAT